MATRTKVPVTIRSRNYKELTPTQGSITRIDFNKSERSKNAVKTFGMGLGLTAFGAMIPIAHYFLVPGGFIATCVFSLDKLNEGARSEGGTGACPKCQKSFVIEKSKIQERLIDTCGACHEEVEILLHLTSPT